MPNPKRRHSHARSGTRRSQNWKMEIISTSRCPNCNHLKIPHRVCPACGFYRDRVVMAVKTQDTKSKENPKK